MHDLRARPIYHHKRESLDPHLTIVFAALAVTRYVEAATGWSIKRFVRTARRYRIVQIRVGQHTVTAEDPLPPIYATHSPRSTDTVRTSQARVRTAEQHQQARGAVAPDPSAHPLAVAR